MYDQLQRMKGKGLRKPCVYDGLTDRTPELLLTLIGLNRLCQTSRENGAYLGGTAGFNLAAAPYGTLWQ